MDRGVPVRFHGSDSAPFFVFPNDLVMVLCDLQQAAARTIGF